MNTIANYPAATQAEVSFNNARLLHFSSRKNATLQDEEPYGFPTIDGNVVTYRAGANAVNNGAGIFIGDYFVGIADNYQLTNMPFIRY